MRCAPAPPRPCVAVKTVKRIIFSEARHHGFDTNRHNYLLLMLVGLQFPLHIWLGSV